VYQSANNAWYADFGYREAEIIGHTTRMLYESDEEYERVGHELYSKLHEREMATVQTRIKRKDGDIREVFVTAAPLQPEDLSAGIVVAVEDITERKLAEEGLRESQRQLADIISFLPDATFVIDRDGVVRAWNREIELMTGVKAEDMVGKGNFEYAIPFYGERRPIIVDIDPLQDREQSGSTMSDIQHEEAVLSGEVWVPQAFGGKGAYLWGRASLLHNAEGQVIGAVKSIRDITERKRAEETRRELEERLQRSEKMEALGLLAGGVAHDLNNVLGILVGYSELLAEDLDKASPLRAHVDYIRQGGERAAAIVQDLLTLARRGVQTREIVDLNAVIDEFRSSPDFEKLQSFYPRVTIETSLASGLMNVKGSPIHLRKTVMNLVSNAAEATPSGGLITIATRNEYLDRPLPGYAQVQEGDYVVLTVSDTGEGISVKDMRRIFEPFYTKKVMGRSGTGLGLSVVWGTVKDHNGYINVQSREGKGSTFTLYFPVTREEASREGIAVPVTAYMGDGESILVVDDVQGQRDLAVQMLKKLCYRVDSVASGEEALDYLKKSRADLLVLDMIMDPGMDGLDTYREILKLHPKQKVIIVSGFSESDRVRQAQALGAGTYVRKPYVLETLGLAVRKEMGKPAS
jgi:PAS domain S-box-containing protein